MVIASNVGRTSSICMPQNTLQLQFDFVVPEKSVYSPGLGPEISDPTPMLEHDRDGFILSELRVESGDFTYIITWKDKPHLLVSVRPQKIRDYVSARTYEEWNSKKILKESRNSECVNLALCEESKKVREKKSEVKRKRKRKQSEELKVCQNLKTEVKILPTRDEHDKSVSLLSQRASFFSPCSQDLDPEETFHRKIKTSSFMEKLTRKNEVTLNLTQARLVRENEYAQSHFDSHVNNYSVTPSHLKLKTDCSLVGSKSHINSTSKTIFTKRGITKSSLKPTKPALNLSTYKPDVDTCKPENHRSSQTSPYTLKVSVISKPQRCCENYPKNGQAKESNQSLENSKKSKSNPPSLQKNSSLTLQPEDKSDCEVEYEVEDIKDEKWEQDKRGNSVVFYLIQWKGNLKNTWEPEENIGSSVLAQYNAKKLARVNNQCNRSSIHGLSPSGTQNRKEAIKFDLDQSYNFDTGGENITKVDRKAKQKAMAINMFEPEVPKRKGGKIPGDLGDEDELFQVTTGKRRK